MAPEEFSTLAPEKQEKQSAANATAPTGRASSKTGSASGATSVEFERCLSSAVHAAGPTRTVRLLASATFKATPALVYVFQPDPNGSVPANTARSAVVVTARAGCKVLATTYL